MCWFSGMYFSCLLSESQSDGNNKNRDRVDLPGCSSWNFVRSYTSSSTMMSRSLVLLCDATSDFENDFDMLIVLGLLGMRVGTK